ncbi:hypothetical protein AVEN_260084-1 [Araneus ventricosus]|uniref:Uncharacterized protein n=1 Tax=Araneus ventricosus TaxID=182803 RepID=A0A4Y2G4T1_ARAVE|nr:hypothetical protein AVEN_260084-1 [Araneus ventricosus]
MQNSPLSLTATLRTTIHSHLDSATPDWPTEEDSSSFLHWTVAFAIQASHPVCDVTEVYGRLPRTEFGFHRIVMFINVFFFNSLSKK